MDLRLNLIILLFLLTVALIVLVILWRDHNKNKKIGSYHLTKNQKVDERQDLEIVSSFPGNHELPFSQILFEAGMDNINQEASERLQNNALSIKKLIDNKIEWNMILTGSADASGNQSRNKELAKRRGQNAKKFLIQSLIKEFPNSRKQVWESKIKIKVDKPIHGFTSQERELLRSVRMVL
ncbi:MAG: OmpA family protein [Leptospira sp.]|nr:OmpA family protein [Leptospira sp.]